MAAPAAVLSILIRANSGQATTALVRVNQQLDATEGKANRLGKAFKVAEKAVGVSALGIAAGFAYSVKKAADFEQQMSRVGAVADASAKDMERLRKQALRAGAATKFSALEAAEAQAELAKGGLGVQRILKGGLRSALALAAAGELELSDAASTTVRAMKLFGLRGKDAMKVADGLATAANRTTADVSDFAIALSQGGSAAKTVGLSFQGTIAALEALAEVGIKGSDAGTSLKVALTQLAAPSSAKAREMAKKLGLEVFDASGKMKSLVDVSKELQDSFDGLTEKQRLQAAKTLVGQDGMRVLLALYDAGPAKIAKFEKGLNKQGTAADTAKKKQDNLMGALENLGGSIETLGITIGTKALPALKDLAQDATKTVNHISRIFGRKDLDLGEKLSRSWAVVKLDAGPWIDEVENAVSKIDVGKILGDAISAATPIIAEAMGQLGIGAAKTFVRAFTEADIWGKLVLGGWLLSKMGGKKAFRALGVTAGGAMGGGMAAGAAAGGAAGGGIGAGTAAGAGVAAGALAKAKGALKVGGKVAGRFAALDLAINLVDSQGNPIAATVNTAHDLTFGVVPKINVDQVKGEQVRADAAKHAQEYSKAFGNALPPVKLDKQGFPISADEWRAQEAERKANAKHAALVQAGVFSQAWISGLEKNREPTRKQIAGMIHVLEELKPGARRAASSSLIGMAAVMETNGKLPKGAARGIRKAIVQNFEDMRVASVRKSGQMVIGVNTAMVGLGSVVTAGLALMHGNVAKALDAFGVKLPKLSLKNPGQTAKQLGKGAGNLLAAVGAFFPQQRGGPINAGTPSGDSVPAMLERGEYVLNRKAVGKVGRKSLDALNFGAAPRFQGGGIVALGRSLQQQGYEVSEHPAFGGVGGHAPGSYHYKGMAIDVNDDDARGGEAASLDRLYARLQGMPGIVELLWRVAGHFDHLHVAMGGGGGGLAALVPKLAKLTVSGSGALKDLAQAALNKVQGAGQSLLNSNAGGAGGGSFKGWSGSWVDLMGTIAKERGWNLGDWRSLVNRESGGNPNAVNPTSGAFGLGQFLGATGKAYAKYGALSHNPVDQIRAMAQYISDRYGTPSSALAFHKAHNWYSQGGPVGLQTGGFPGMSPLNRAAGAGPLTAGFRPASGGLNKLTRTARHGTGRQRRRAIRKFLDRVEKIGLPEGLTKTLRTLGENADIFDGYATRAGALNVFDDDGNLVSAGVVNGKNEIQWLTDELAALFEWRNKIIRAQEIIVERREKVGRMLEAARTRFAGVKKEIRHRAATLDALGDKLKEAQKHPKANKDKIKALRKTIRGLTGEQNRAVHVRDALKTVIGDDSSGLVGKRAALNTARGDLLGTLGDVQGLGSPMERMGTLPAVGVLGGRIFDVQMRLRELTAEKPTITDTAATVTDNADLLELLRQANLRTAVSEAQFKVFRDFPQFAGGGIVPGVAGSAVPAVVHAGEGVFTQDQMAALGGGQPVVVVVQDGAVREDRIKVISGKEAERVLRQQTRPGTRRLPGRPGSLN